MKEEIIKRHRLVNVLRRTAMREIMGDIHWGQEPILDYLIKNGGSPQKQLAEFLHVTPASIALSTKRMEKSGLVTKTADVTNLRRKIICVTQKGRELFENFRKGMDKLDDKMFLDFSDAELSEMERLYDKIIFNLTGETKEITHEVFCHYINKLKDLDGEKEKRRGKNKK